jgi:hypothetical protein
MTGVHAGGKEARARLGVEKMGHAGELWGEKAQTVEHQGCDCMAGGPKPPCRVWLRRLIHALRHAEFFQPPRDQTEVISDLCAV